MTQELKLFAEATRRVQQQLSEMIASEKEKRQALLTQDMTRLEAVLPAQQAMVMKLESLEKKRMEAQEAAGFSGLTAAAILEKLSPEERTQLEPLFRETRETATVYSELNRAALEIANTELRLMDQIVRNAGVESSGLYGQNGRVENTVKGAAFTEKV